MDLQEQIIKLQREKEDLIQKHKGQSQIYRSNRRKLAKELLEFQEKLLQNDNEILVLKGEIGLKDMEISRLNKSIDELRLDLKQARIDNNRLLMQIQNKEEVTELPESLIPKDNKINVIEEYFKLVVLSVRLNYSVIGGEETESLYSRALNSNIPFHEYNTWVEEQLNCKTKETKKQNTTSYIKRLKNKITGKKSHSPRVNSSTEEMEISDSPEEN